MQVTVKAGADKDGKLTALQLDVLSTPAPTAITPARCCIIRRRMHRRL